MVAGLLYVIGLITLLVSIVMVGYAAPTAVGTLTEAMDSGTANMLEVALSVALSFQWAVTPLVGGLVLMGLGRVVMLLSAINRSLRGDA